jgi:serine/threonine protein kinase
MQRALKVDNVQASLQVGAVIQGRYMIESLLGKGSFGNIYLVWDQHTKQKLFVLAEVINPNDLESYRFTLDYVSLTPFRHQALPQVQYVFNDDKLNRAYLLMSYIEEPNLEILRLQQPEKCFPLTQVRALMAPVVNAVTYLHHQDPPVIHRNIQPTIIIPANADESVLVMLGIMKEYDSTTTTLDYLAPGYGATEQYKEEFSPRTDIYGLGATYYTLLTGSIPPDALYRSSQLSNGEIDPLKPLNEVIPTIPAFMAEAIQRAMSITADDRFLSLEQFWEALRPPGKQFSLQTSTNMQSNSPPSPTELLQRPFSPSPTQKGETVGSPHALVNGYHPLHSDPKLDFATALLSPMASKQAVERPAPEFVPEQPRAPRPRKPGTLQLALSRQTVKKPATASIAKQPRSWKPGVLLIAFALLIILGTGAVYWSDISSHPATHSGTLSMKSSTLTPHPVSSIYPTLTGTYSGTIYDVSADVSTSMVLTGIRQSKGNINGYLTLGPKLQGSGPFSGTIAIAKELKFTVTNTAESVTLFFEGIMLSATSLTGDFYRCSSVGPGQESQCKQAPDSYGIWNIVLTKSEQYSKYHESNQAE